MRNALSVFVTGLLISAAHAQLPVSGRPVPGMTAFDGIMRNFMTDNSITAGVLGISRNGRLEYLRSFGWLVQPAGGDPGVPLPENAMMRTASAVKPVTAAAVRQLSADGAFGATGLNSHAFKLIVGVDGLLNVPALPQLGDSRHADVTLHHLLLHQGGFDRSVDPPCDVMGKSRTVAAALGINSPPSNWHTMGYMLGRALQWAPGTVSNLNSPPGTDAYSNYGYMVLGEVLQAYAPGGYLGYVHSRLMSPAWIPSTEFALARSLVPDRHPREPRYIASYNGQSVFDNDPPIAVVPMPDGGLFMEAGLAPGGVIASAQAMIHFANAYHCWYVIPASDAEIGEPVSTAKPMRNAAHSGQLDGTNTFLQQRDDGIVFYLALNRFNFAEPSYAAELARRINDQLNAGGFTWPEAAADGFWVTLGTENGSAGFGSYQSNYQGFQSALDRVTDGSSLRLRPGAQRWTGPITKRVRLDAPEGAVTLGL